MDRHLLLLGLLRQSDMHGYQLNALLEDQTKQAIALKKSTAYDLLRKMENNGWIVAREEQAGKRPVRRVYAITPDGEAAFRRLLRERLAEHPTPEFPALVSLNLLRWLPEVVGRALLQERRKKVAETAQQLDAAYTRGKEADNDPLALIDIEYKQRFYRLELDWIDECLARLSRSG